ncbi:MAG: peptidase E [Candidatus Sungbacteria bacterium]|nr:peptidase E [Candidatus Sungbacteria bacterium]
MKLLLTSGGLSNQPIIDGLFELIGTSIRDVKIAFIPTAANVETGDKGWLVKDLVQLRGLNPASLDIVDFSAVSRDIWQPRMEEADVLVFGGGNTFHLMYHLEKSGLKDMLPGLLETRVYVGVSAGSMVMGKKLLSQSDARLYYDDVGKYEKENGLGFVDFDVKPHLNSPYFPNMRDEHLKKTAEQLKETMYAIDDETAIKVIDGKVEIISEGKWIKYN